MKRINYKKRDTAAYCEILKRVLTNKAVELDGVDIFKILNIAKLNKVDLEVFRKLVKSNKITAYPVKHITDQLEREYNKVLSTLSLLEPLFSDGEILLIKFRKKYSYVPSDIDILVHPSHVRKVILTLQELHFRRCYLGSYTVTLKAPNGVLVDIYVYPTLGDMIYMDPRDLFVNASDYKIDDIRVKVPNTCDELKLLTLHAVIKERTITLNDMHTFLSWYSTCNNIISTAYANIFGTAYRYFSFSCPVRIPLSYWLLAIAREAYRNKLMKATLYKLLLTVPKLPRETVKKLLGKGY